MILSDFDIKAKYCFGIPTIKGIKDYWAASISSTGKFGTYM